MINGLRYLTDDLIAIQRMGHEEYQLRLDAVTLQRVDEIANQARQALFNRRAKATDKQGMYINNEIKDFVDIKTAEVSVFEDTDSKQEVFSELREIAKRMEELKQGEAHGKSII